MKRPYKIESIILVLYDGRNIPVEIVEDKILDRPFKAVKESILDAFSTMKNNPVDVKIKIKYI